MTKPIFILSLPRSGSTLLQRLLLGSGKCSTLGEPSLLLRLLGEDESMDRRSLYWESLVTIAKRDMREKWPAFDQVYAEGVRYLMSRIYTGLADGKEYFIDKTPRYTLIANEIIKVFPDAKFIVLWRHPLAIAASMTVGKGRWYPEEHSIDLYEGVRTLEMFSQSYSDQICEVMYEDLVARPAQELRRIGTYLELPKLESVLTNKLAASAGGSLGDKTGVKKYNTVSQESSQCWHKHYNNWFRRRWARCYIAYHEDSRLFTERYTMPSSTTECSFFNMGLFSGLIEYIRSGIRRYRRHYNPVWLKRFSRHYLKRHGYGVSYK